MGRKYPARCPKTGFLPLSFDFYYIVDMGIALITDYGWRWVSARIEVNEHGK
jgi:hypothetical protein